MCIQGGEVYLRWGCVCVYICTYMCTYVHMYACVLLCMCRILCFLRTVGRIGHVGAHWASPAIPPGGAGVADRACVLPRSGQQAGRRTPARGRGVCGGAGGGGLCFKYGGLCFDYGGILDPLALAPPPPPLWVYRSWCSLGTLPIKPASADPPVGRSLSL